MEDFLTGERYSHPSSFQLLPSHISFSTVWFLPLALVMVIVGSAVMRLAQQKAQMVVVPGWILRAEAADRKQVGSLAAAPVAPATTTCSTEPTPTDKPPRPRHLAVIMDGNRRYGRQKHGVPTKGHWDGGHTLIEFVKWCLAEGIQAVTVYAFSSENWSRPEHEINVLMQIFLRYCARIEEESVKNGIRVRFLSTSPHRFATDVLERFRRVEETSKDCTTMTLNVCVSYGAREELAMACRSISDRVKEGELRPEDITPKTIADALLTRDVPDPDLILRTSGEQRLSNFLLFQAAYAEFVFVDKYWPAITREDFNTVLDEFARRKRRFGK